MSAEAFSESLQFPNVKKRAVASRSYRVRLPPTNSTSFLPGQTVQFDLPANLAGSYFNSNQCYLKFKLTNTGGNVDLDRCGALGLFRRMQISTSGAQIADIDRYNTLSCAMLDADASQEWKTSVGAKLMGTTGNLRGEFIPAAGTRDFCVPFVLNPLSQTTPHRMIPLFSLSSLQIRMTLDDAATALHHHGAAAANYSLSEVEMVMMVTELSAGAQAQIDAMTGGNYQILCTSWIHSSASIPAGVTSVTANLGFSMSSLERVVIAITPTATENATAAYSLGNRCSMGLSEYSLLINSEQYPARPIVVGGQGAEPLAEMLISDHSLADFSRGNGLQNGYAPIAGTTVVGGPGFSSFANISPNIGANAPDPYLFSAADATGLSPGLVATAALPVASDVGTFLAAIELESAISDGRSSHIYSGISTLASTVQLLMRFNTATAAAATAHCFANFTVLLSLNSRGTGVYSISI
tara:strand:+ start:908 stop:2311 length:1404 start_codon:yes stop_codon:yes gene_type:complete